MKKYIAFIMVALFSVSTFAYAAQAPAPSASPSATVAEAVASPTPETSTMAELCGGKWVSDKLQNALADVVTKTVTLAGNAKDFVVGELPDVIKQLLRWKFAQSIAPMVVSLIFAIFFLVWFNRTTVKDGDWRDSNTNRYGYKALNGFPKMWFGIFKAAVGVASLISFFANINFVWLQIWLAPKVYLIEYAKSMFAK